MGNWVEGRSTVDTAVVNFVAFINCLPTDESGDASALVELVRELSRDRGWPAPFYREARTASEVLAAIEELRVESARTNSVPLLHLDAHGDIDGLVRLAPVRGSSRLDGSLSWKALFESLGRLNHQCSNRMFVALCACYGLFSSSEIDLKSPAPYSVVIAPLEEILAQEVDSSLMPFYREVLAGHSPDVALRAVRPYFELFSIEVALKKVLVSVVLDTLGRKGKARRGRLRRQARKKIGRAVSQKVIGDRTEAGLTLSDTDIESFLGTVLCGREPPYSAADIREEAMKIHVERQSSLIARRTVRRG